jgi:hypothetical protein
MATEKQKTDLTPRLVRSDRNWKAGILAKIRARIGGGVRRYQYPEWAPVQLCAHKSHGFVFPNARILVTLGRKDLFQPSAFVEIFSAARHELTRIASGDVKWLEQPAFMTLQLRLSLLGGIDNLRTELTRCREVDRQIALTELIGEYDYERKQRRLRQPTQGLLPGGRDWRQVSGGRVDSNRRRH